MAFNKTKETGAIESNLCFREMIKLHIHTRSFDKFLRACDYLAQFNFKVYECTELDDLVRKGLRVFSDHLKSKEEIAEKLKALKIENKKLKNFILSVIK